MRHPLSLVFLVLVGCEYLPTPSTDTTGEASTT